ncbi:ATP-binding protein [Capilliphycus salinus ALCB114379]|uniref:hybrid sensor histidine kinase/response regulator n=1 Tax=Capilliphycus salinus TaxID=2768948 RepID=UPI0039A5E8E0
MNSTLISESEYILLVDDQIDNLTLLANILTEAEYNVRRVKSGTLALNLAKSQEKPALILLDILMPEIDGYQVCRQLKSEEDTRDIPVIFLSALDEIQNQSRGFEVGGADYITKPFNNQEVLIRVRHQLNLQKLQKQRILEAELRQSLIKEQELNRFRQKIIETISHEYRTPLAVILNSSELIEYRLRDQITPAIKKQFDRIKLMIVRLTNLVNDVLFANQVERDNIELNITSFNAVETCQSIIENLQKFSENERTIRFSFSENLNQENINFDLFIFRQIIEQLLKNALKFSGVESVVSLQLIREDHQLMIEVADRGIGIPLEDQDRIFELFYRGSNIETRPGVGLGLAIVKKSVDLCQGEINFSSQVGEGTCFTIKLPLSIEDL